MTFFYYVATRIYIYMYICVTCARIYVPLHFQSLARPFCCSLLSWCRDNSPGYMPLRSRGDSRVSTCTFACKFNFHRPDFWLLLDNGKLHAQPGQRDSTVLISAWHSSQLFSWKILVISQSYANWLSRKDERVRCICSRGASELELVVISRRDRDTREKNTNVLEKTLNTEENTS